MEGEQATDATPKRAKTDGTGERDEMEDGGDAMIVDGDEGLKREPDLRERVAAYLRDPATALKPDPPDVPSFMESPFRYNPKAKILNPEETQGKVDADGNTALIMAIKAGSEKAFFLLLDGKDQAYINRQNSKGATALNVAAHRGYVAPVRELLDTAHADVNIPNSSGSTSLIQASHFGHTAVVRLLLQHGAAVDLPNHKGTTALMRAAQEGHVAVVAALLRTGGDVNRRNHERMNALMLASQRGHDGIVHMLIKHGADIDCQTVQGSTALMLACKRQHEAVVRVLLTAGAEMFVRDSRGRTARDTAVKRNHKPIIAMLQASRQVRLMQQEARIVRSRVLVHMYELLGRKRAVPIPEVAAGLAARENRRRSREEARRAQTQRQEWGKRAYGRKGGGEG
ncbi:nacht and ankyrin domain protein, partial [Nannochloropsis gaditana CCMP526]